MTRIVGAHHCCDTNCRHSREVKVSPSLLDGPGRMRRALLAALRMRPPCGPAERAVPEQDVRHPGQAGVDERVPNAGFYTLMYGKVRPGYLPAAQPRTNEMLRGSIRSSMPGCSTIALGGDRAASAGHDAGDRHQAGYTITIDVRTSAFHRVSDFADTVDPPTGPLHRVHGVGA